MRPPYAHAVFLPHRTLKRVFSKEEFLAFTDQHPFEVLLMAGAGDLDLLIPTVTDKLLKKAK